MGRALEEEVGAVIMVTLDFYPVVAGFVLVPMILTVVLIVAIWK
jgi:hypothetical protein